MITQHPHHKLASTFLTFQNKAEPKIKLIQKPNFIDINDHLIRRFNQLTSGDQTRLQTQPSYNINGRKIKHLQKVLKKHLQNSQKD